ncbi:calcium load-activated calcium channel [Citrus sinensis]|nr:calcium load-activated calcium channel [Citrus sinensis]
MGGKEEEGKIEALYELAEPLIYQTNSYKFLKSSINKASKKLTTTKIENLAKISTQKSRTKTIDRVKTSLKESSHYLSSFKFNSNTIVTLVLFEGKVVVKLLFKPFGIVMKMSHRRLQGHMLK